MGKYRLKIGTEAISHIALHKRNGNVIALKKINAILKELAIHPKSGIGKPELLKHELGGLLVSSYQL